MAVAMAVATSAAAPAWAQGGYTVMAGTQAPPPAPPGATTQVVAPPQGDAPVAGTTRLRPGAPATVRGPNEYGGVTPGLPALPPGLRRARRPGGPLLVAWPGFQMTPSGSRLFVVLTSQQPVVEAQRNGRTRVYHIPQARILLSNNRRPLLTEAFNTPLARAWLRPAGRGVDLVLELRADAEPTIAQEAGPQGFQFVYVNLPPWQAPEIARVILPNGAAVSVTADPRATPVPGGAPGAPAVTPVVAPARGPMIDNERPPGR